MKVYTCLFTDANFPILFSVADVELVDVESLQGSIFKVSLISLFIGLFNAGYQKVQIAHIAWAQWLALC